MSEESDGAAVPGPPPPREHGEHEQGSGRHGGSLGARPPDCKPPADASLINSAAGTREAIGEVLSKA
jgi:hypothetical protein